jgi:cardiolipin synthase
MSSPLTGSSTIHRGAEIHGPALGVNTEPGAHDDGWSKPPPVPLQDGSRVQLFKDGEGLKAAYDAIAEAERRIALEVYTFEPDATGRAFAELLIRKAREGVNVYVIYDAFGSSNSREQFRQMARVGVHLASFHPVRPWELKFSWRPFNRDHRKLLIVDDRIAGVGGLNIADPYAGNWVTHTGLEESKFWRDTSMGVVGPSARPFMASFAHTWNYIQHGGRIRRAEYYHEIDLDPPAKGRRLGKPSRRRPRRVPLDRAGELPDAVGVFASVPTLSSPLRPMLYRMINGAQESVDLTMAYFAPDDELIESLCRAAMRGVRVRLMMAGRSDVGLLIVAARSFYGRLLRAGVEVYERQAAVLHAKTLCVDERVSIVGSTNLDYRSIEFNCEISGIVRARAFGRQMAALFENDIRYAERIERDAWRNRAWWDRFVQWGVNRMRYVL